VDERRTPSRAGLGGTFALLTALAGVFLWVSMLTGPFRLATGLVDAATHLEKAEKALSKAATKTARYETLAAVAATERARSGLESDSPLLTLARHLPTASDVLKEVPHLVAAAEHSAAAAEGTLDVAQNALRGPDKVIARDPEDPEGGGRIRLDRIEAIARTISNVRAEIREAKDELEAVELGNLPRRARKQVREGIEKAADTNALLADAEDGFAILPSVLGAEGPRTYVLGMQNSAEQRGTGGALLQFAVFTIVDGKPRFSKESSTVYDVDKDRRQFTIPLPEDAWYVAGIPDAQRFGNANWSPDWPLSAQVTIAYAAAAAATLPEPLAEQFPVDDVDGFIAVDPMAMEKLMPGVGPYTAGEEKGRSVYVTANRLVDFVLYKAYAKYPNQAFRRARLRDIVDGFYENVFKPRHPSALVDGFGAALAEKHMQIWMTDPAEQAFIEHMDWDGAMRVARESDYLYVVEQNVGGNKFDYFSENTTTMDVTIEGDDAVVSTETRVRNGVFLPQPRWSAGDSAKSGLHRPMMNVYVPLEAELVGAAYEGERLATPPGLVAVSDVPTEHVEKGKRVWSATFDIPPGQEAAMRLDYRVPAVVRSREGRRVYRLIVQRQPKVRPEQLRITLTLPEDARGVRAPGWKRKGGVLVRDKPLKRDLELEVSWQE
jgi:urease gamma subunit